MNILLINPIATEDEPPKFPLGLGYIASVLLKAGHQVKLLDIAAHRWQRDTVSKKLEDCIFDIAGITGLITQYDEIKWLCASLKEIHPDKIVVLGGPLASSLPKLILQETEADIAVVGEGESTILDLMNVLTCSRNVSVVNGIWYKEVGIILHTPTRVQIQHLDSIPFPAWHLFPMDIYLRSAPLGFDSSMPSMSMITSRGCPYRCTYCDHSVYGYRYRARTARNIVDEIKALKQRYRIRAITFADDLFTLDKKMVHKFCELLLSEGVRLMWACNGRVNLVDKELLRRMRAAGCVFMGYGIESGSPTILREMNKQATLEQAREAIHLTWEAGITPFAYMMIGMPGESQQTFRETVDFSKEIGIVEAFGFVTPLPGTSLYEQARETGKVSDLKGLVKGWKNWGKQCLVNMTTLSNEELVALKTEGEKEIAEHFLRSNQKLLLKKIYFYCRVHGFMALVRQLVAWIGKYFGRQRGKVSAFSRGIGIDESSFKKEDFRVLVIALQGLGNALLITPLLHALKVGISNQVKISILVLEKSGEEVLRENPDVDEIIVVDPSQQRLLSFFKFMRNLRSKKFDLAVVAWPGGIRSAIIAFLCGAKMRIGHRQNTALFNFFPFLYTHRLISEGLKHDLERNLEFAQALGIEVISTKMVFPLTEQDRVVAQRFLSQSGIGNNLLFGLHPGSGSEMSYKRWPQKRFAEFGNRLVKQYNGAVIIFGGSEEIALMEQVATLMKPKPLLVKNASLKKTAALIERCKVFISNDSGLMHLATAMGVPTVGIFGPTEPDKTAPYGEQNRIVRKEFGCSPCFRFEKRRFRCSTLECLKSITVENVLEVVDDLLSRGNNP